MCGTRKYRKIKKSKYWTEFYKQKREHPKLPRSYLRMIVKDHLRKGIKE